jgi:hypothetical protein
MNILLFFNLNCWVWKLAVHMFAEMIGRAGGYQDLFCCTYGGKDGREDKYLMMEYSTLALFYYFVPSILGSFVKLSAGTEL